MSWKDYVPHAIAGTAGTSGLFFFTFRDAINKAWEEYRAERKQARDQKHLDASRGDVAINKLISVFEKNLSDQHLTIESMRLLLERMVIAHERSLDVQRMASTQMSDVDKRLLRIEGAINAGGGFRQ